MATLRKKLDTLKARWKNNKNHWGWYDILMSFITLFFNLILTQIIQKYNPIGIPLVSSWDGLIPLLPLFVVPYILFSPFLVLCVFFVRKNVKMRQALLTAYALTTVISFLFYIFYQTAMIRPEITQSGVLNTILYFIYSADAPLNAFPSLHVGLTTCALFFLRKKLKWFYIFGLLIIASTVFVKQHFLWDVFGGLIVATVCIPISIIIVSRFIQPKANGKEIRKDLE